MHDNYNDLNLYSTVFLLELAEILLIHANKESIEPDYMIGEIVRILETRKVIPQELGVLV